QALGFGPAAKVAVAAIRTRNAKTIKITVPRRAPRSIASKTTRVSLIMLRLRLESNVHCFASIIALNAGLGVTSDERAAGGAESRGFARGCEDRVIGDRAVFQKGRFDRLARGRDGWGSPLSAQRPQASGP